MIEKTGLDPRQKVEELTMDQLETVADTFPDVAGWELGESYDSDSAAPDWVEDLWESPTDAGETGSSEAATTSDDAPTDNS
ncbi:hypothetical protein [Limnoglobus roseus]|uniref:hypothetical protein n=1 Tax=Limnoglobus roseus TaxID=2598579 RepID=UPI00143D565D|nr:hypothetical protein [Limnoglobus roseus]